LGYVKVKTKIWNVKNPKLAKKLELLADPEAVYTVLPKSLLKELKVEVVGKRKFRLANNEVVEKEVGIIGVEVNGLITHTLTVFGDENIFLLGVVTLEELGLQVDPVKGKLKPLELLLMNIFRFNKVSFHI